MERHLTCNEEWSGFEPHIRLAGSWAIGIAVALTRRRRRFDSDRANLPDLRRRTSDNGLTGVTALRSDRGAMVGLHARPTTGRERASEWVLDTATMGADTAPTSHMTDETIHTEGDRFDIREDNGKLYVYDKEEGVKLAYLVQT